MSSAVLTRSQAKSRLVNAVRLGDTAVAEESARWYYTTTIEEFVEKKTLAKAPKLTEEKLSSVRDLSSKSSSTDLNRWREFQTWTT
jgi:hypothetical protein